jgi:LacI family transcriptional regulator
VGSSVTSRVLNDDPTVSVRPETRERILAAALALDYTPDAFARGLKTARTMTLGLVLPNLAYAVNAEIIRGAERQAASKGYVLLIADADEFVQAGDAYRRLLFERRVDGLLIASATTGSRVIKDLSSQPLPFVLVNRRQPGLGVNVSLDDEAGTAMAVSHLAALGHRRIAHIAGPPDADTARRRLAGYRSGMAANGLRPASSMIVAAPFSERGGFDAATSLLNAPSRATALVTASLASAVGAMAAARALGLSVPNDVSVTGFHDAPIAEYLHPALTTVRMPLREMAEVAVRTLVGLIGGEASRDVTIATAPVLITRGSTAAPS